MISLATIEINKHVQFLVNNILESKSIGQSEVIGVFEDEMAHWCGVKHCIAVASGTVADTIALAVLKHFHPEKKEVIFPGLGRWNTE